MVEGERKRATQIVKAEAGAERERERAREAQTGRRSGS